MGFLSDFALTLKVTPKRAAVGVWNSVKHKTAANFSNGFSPSEREKSRKKSIYSKPNSYNFTASLK